MLSSICINLFRPNYTCSDRRQEKRDRTIEVLTEITNLLDRYVDKTEREKDIGKAKSEM